ARRIGDRIERRKTRNVDRSTRDQVAVAPVLLHKHSAGKNRPVDVVRIRIRNPRFALGSEPDLNEIAEGAIASLPASESIYAAAVIEGLARLDWGRKSGASGVPFQALPHQEHHVAVGAA